MSESVSDPGEKQSCNRKKDLNQGLIDYLFLLPVDIILQHANSTPSTSSPISSFSLKTSSAVKDGERSVVVLQQQHQTPASIVPVRPFAQAHNNRLPPAPPAIAAAAAAAAAASFNSSSTSSPSVRLSRSIGASGVRLHFTPSLLPFPDCLGLFSINSRGPFTLVD